MFLTFSKDPNKYYYRESKYINTKKQKLKQKKKNQNQNHNTNCVCVREREREIGFWVTWWWRRQWQHRHGRSI